MQQNALLTLMLLGVAFVNGWTDAPDAIAASVASGALNDRNAARVSAAGNLIGACAGALFFPAIAQRSAQFLGANADCGMLSAILLTVILWAVAAQRFGIPTSESHALPAAMTGAALARGSCGLPAPAQIATAAAAAGWGTLLIAIIGSIAAGAVGGFCFCRLLRRIRISLHTALSLQRVLAFLSSVLHGALDVPKFALLLGILYGAPHAFTPFFCSVLCGASVALGCRSCGRRIIDHLTREVTCPGAIASAAADMGASLCVFAALLAGLPLGTTQIRTAALTGACTAEGSPVARRGLFGMVAAWIVTIPCCAALAFLFTRIFS